MLTPQLPIGFQLVPVGIMVFLVPFIKESPRWLATKHKEDQALANLAWIRNLPADDFRVQAEFAEICAAIKEEEAAKAGGSWRDVFAKGNPIRFIIAFVMFTLQQWSGQNSQSGASFFFGISDGFRYLVLRSSNLQGHWYSWFVDVAARFGHIRYRQDRRHIHLHRVRCRAIRSEEAPASRRSDDVWLPVDHRSHLRFAPALDRPRCARFVCVSRHGRHDLPLRHSLLLLRRSPTMGLLRRE